MSEQTVDIQNDYLIRECQFRKKLVEKWAALSALLLGFALAFIAFHIFLKSDIEIFSSVNLTYKVATIFFAFSLILSLKYFTRLERIIRGRTAEEEATHLLNPLAKKGWKISRNIPIYKDGDIDILCKHGSTVIAIEVKSYLGAYALKNGTLFNIKKKQKLGNKILPGCKRRAAKYASEQKIKFVTPVLCLMNASFNQQFYQLENVWITNRNSLKEVINKIAHEKD
jgi:Holliday junction resolvase-like predicted endonuclease